MYACMFSCSQTPILLRRRLALNSTHQTPAVGRLDNAINRYPEELRYPLDSDLLVDGVIQPSNN